MGASVRPIQKRGQMSGTRLVYMWLNASFNTAFYSIAETNHCSLFARVLPVLPIHTPLYDADVKYLPIMWKVAGSKSFWL